MKVCCMLPGKSSSKEREITGGGWPFDAETVRLKTSAKGRLKTSAKGRALISAAFLFARPKDVHDFNPKAKLCQSKQTSNNQYIVS